MEMKTLRIDAKGMHYTPLNQKIRAAVADGVEEITLDNVLGQRFIGDGLRGNVKIIINGVPGGDLGVFMSGPTCIIQVGPLMNTPKSPPGTPLIMILTFPLKPSPIKRCPSTLSRVISSTPSATAALIFWFRGV